MEMSVSDQVPQEEEDVQVAVLENKPASDKLAEEFRLFKTAFDFIYDAEPCMIRVLKPKQMVEELVLYRNIYREVKTPNRNDSVRCKVTRSVLPRPASPPTSCTQDSKTNPSTSSSSTSSSSADSV